MLKFKLLKTATHLNLKNEQTIFKHKLIMYLFIRYLLYTLGMNYNVKQAQVD